MARILLLHPAHEAARYSRESAWRATLKLHHGHERTKATSSNRAARRHIRRLTLLPPVDDTPRTAPAPVRVRAHDRLDRVTKLLRQRGMDRAVVVDLAGRPTGVIVMLGGDARALVDHAPPPPTDVTTRPPAAAGEGDGAWMELAVTCPRCQRALPWDTRFCPQDGVDLSDLGRSARSVDMLLGRVLGAYRLVGRLGEGGMGVVYRAEHTETASAVAVKVILPCFARNADVLARFFQEARAMNRVQHANVVHVFDCGRCADGTPFCAMELLEGNSLADVLRMQGRLPVERAVNIARQIALGVGAAHDAGVVHRDLKPGNIMLARLGSERDHVKVLDFGIAKLIDGPESAEPVTLSGARVGTPYYMSPEQIMGREVDHRTDLYTFGVVLYRMLTGNLPFDGTPTESMRDHLTAPVPPLRAPGVDFPPALRDLVTRCLSKAVEGRPSSFAEVVSILEAVADGREDPVTPLDDEWTGIGGVPAFSPMTPPPLPGIAMLALPTLLARPSAQPAIRREPPSLGFASGVAMLFVAGATIALLALGSGRASKLETAVYAPPPCVAPAMV